MEIILEFLGTVLFDGCFEVIKNEKINPVVRKLLLILVTLFYVSLGGFFIFIAYDVDSILMKIVFSSLVVVFLALLIKLWKAVYKVKLSKIEKEN